MDSLQFQQKLIGIQDRLMNFALKLTANREDALDLLQDTTLKVLNSQEKFTDNVNFAGWVMVIMRNLFINLNITCDSISGSPDKIYQIKEITKAIAALNEDYKIPFSLFVNGYKYQEIADKLNLPLGTVKSRIFFARKELQNKLDGFQYA